MKDKYNDMAPIDISLEELIKDISKEMETLTKHLSLLTGVISVRSGNIVDTLGDILYMVSSASLKLNCCKDLKNITSNHEGGKP